MPLIWLGTGPSRSAAIMKSAPFGLASAAGDVAAEKLSGAGKGGSESARADAKIPAADPPTGEKPAGSGKLQTATATGPDGSTSAGGGGVPRSLTQEEVSVFSRLTTEKRQLDLREAELSKLEEELQKQRTELEKKLAQLESIRKEIASALKTKVEGDRAKVDKLVLMYSDMKAQQAAKVIETLNEDLAVEILEKMKKKNAADVLNVMGAKKAQKLSEILAGYKRAE